MDPSPSFRCRVSLRWFHSCSIYARISLVQVLVHRYLSKDWCESW